MAKSHIAGPLFMSHASIWLLELSLAALMVSQYRLDLLMGSPPMA